MALLVAAIVAFTPGIRTPTGNITCFVSQRILHCAIRSYDFARPRCESVDWHGWELTTTRRAAVTCSGGILYDPRQGKPRYATLPYGRTWRHGAFTCDSERVGLTCRNRTGHGLFLSRQSWRAW